MPLNTYYDPTFYKNIQGIDQDTVQISDITFEHIVQSDLSYVVSLNINDEILFLEIDNPGLYIWDGTKFTRNMTSVTNGAVVVNKGIAYNNTRWVFDGYSWTQYQSQYSSTNWFYSQLIDKLSDVNESLQSMISIQNKILNNFGQSLSEISISQNNISIAQHELLNNFQTLNRMLSDETVGANIKYVDLPYQGVYSRAMSRMTLEETQQEEKLAKAVKQEQISPMFKSE